MYVAMGITADEYRDRDLAIRNELLELRRREVKRGWWDIVGTVATVGIPIATFLGWQAYFNRGRK